MSTIKSISNPLATFRKGYISVVVIGAGGTGSNVLQQLGRIHYALQARNQSGLFVTLVDPDRVSAANLHRQLFNVGDIGRYKSDVLIENINRWYNVQWESNPERFEVDKDPNSLSSSANIYISCTDTASSRIAINSYLKANPQTNLHEGFRYHYWIDTGNSKTTGQVIMGSHRYNLPTVIDLYPNIAELEDKDNTPSCSLAEALEKQHMFINSMVAHTCGHLVYEVCTEEKLSWFGAYINLNSPTPIVKIREVQSV